MLCQSSSFLLKKACLSNFPLELLWVFRAGAENREPYQPYELLENHVVLRTRGICNAQRVSNLVAPRNNLFWDSLISAYVKSGDARRALNVYQRMHDGTLQLSAYTYVALLKSCTEPKDVDIGCKLHAQIVQSGLLECNPFVGTALVVMYAKHGMLNKARELFDKLPAHDVASWNALISSYLLYALSEEALACFEKMQLKGICPNAVTFTCILKACGCVRAIRKGRQIHSQVMHSGVLETNQFVGNALVDMYAKCGLLSMAKEMFSILPARNIVTWNTLIAGYVQHERSEEALKSFAEMQLEGVFPDGVTFACALKACGSLRALQKGKDLHTDIEKRRLLETDQVVAIALVDMYVKCGMLAKAQEVFDSLQNHDVVLWSALIAGYTQQERGQEALSCYELMQLQGVAPNDVTYACILKACGNIGATVKGREIHADLDKKGLYKANQLIGNALIDMYAKFGLVDKGQEVFDMLPVRNIVSWNTLIAGYVQQECGKEALNCFEQMKLQGLSPSEVTFACILKACGLTGAIDKGRELHAEVDMQRLLDRNIIVGNALVDMYAKCGVLAMAQDVFEKLPFRDIISWNALIAGYVQQERAEEALNCFAQMQSQGVSADAVTLACCLKACGSIGATEMGKEIHSKIDREGLFKTSQLVGNALVDMYVKCGMLAKAQEVFDILPTRDIVSWTALITGYAQLGEYESVFHSFDRMRGEGIMPNPVTFLSVLSACSHTGLVDKGQIYFEAMIESYSLTPTLEHHICMVDLFSRAGQLDRAVVYTKKVSPQPNIMMWLTVLGACRKWGNVVLGRQAFDEVLLLDEGEASAFVCMYNIYADAGLYDDARLVKAMRVEKQTLMRLESC